MTGKRIPHILIVEPDVKLAAMYAAVLRQRQYMVTVVAGAQDAITAADERRPDIVILELQLVAHGGVEFLYEFRSYEDWLAVPVIILSHVTPTALVGSRQLLEQRLGVEVCLYKPQTSLQALCKAVERAFASKQAAEAQTV